MMLQPRHQATLQTLIPIDIWYFEFDFEILRLRLWNTSNFELAYFDFETLTLTFEVNKLNFETSTLKYFDTRNAEAYFRVINFNHNKFKILIKKQWFYTWASAGKGKRGPFPNPKCVAAHLLKNTRYHFVKNLIIYQ